LFTAHPAYSSSALLNQAPRLLYGHGTELYSKKAGKREGVEDQEDGHLDLTVPAPPIQDG